MPCFVHTGERTHVGETLVERIVLKTNRFQDVKKKNLTGHKKYIFGS